MTLAIDLVQMWGRAPWGLLLWHKQSNSPKGRCHLLQVLCSQ